MNRVISDLQEDVMRGKINRRTFLCNAILLGVSLTSAQALLAACMPPAPAAAPTPLPTPEFTPPSQPSPQPQSLTVAFPASPQSFDTHFWTGWRDLELCNLIFDTGIYRNPQGEVLNWAFTDWSTQDFYTWQFKIREGIEFTNGNPLRAEEVKFSFERMIDPELNAPISAPRVMKLHHCDVVDEYTVNFVCENQVAHSQLGWHLTEWPFMDPAHYKGLSPDEAGKSPMGTGPYIVEEFVKDERYVFKPKPNYWNAEQLWGGDGSSRWDSYIWKIIPEASTRVAAVQAGEADIAHLISLDVARSLPGPDAAGEVHAAPALTDGRIFMYINQTYQEDSKLKDKRVRQALNHGVNWEQISQQLWLGQSLRLASLIGPWSVHYHPELKPYPYDPEKAKALLEEAGVPDGYPLKLWTSSSGDPEIPLTAQAIAADYQKLGFNAEVETLPSQTLVRASRAREVEADLMLWNFGGSAVEATAALGQLRLDYWGNITGWENAEFYELWDSLGTPQAMDPQKRREIALRMQEISHEEAVLVPLGVGIRAHVIGPRVKWTPRFDQFVFPWEVTLA